MNPGRHISSRWMIEAMLYQEENKRCVIQISVTFYIIEPFQLVLKGFLRRHPGLYFLIPTGIQANNDRLHKDRQHSYTKSKQINLAYNKPWDFWEIIYNDF